MINDVPKSQPVHRQHLQYVLLLEPKVFSVLKEYSTLLFACTCFFSLFYKSLSRMTDMNEVLDEVSERIEILALRTLRTTPQWPS